MSTWVKADYRFAPRSVVFVIDNFSRVGQELRSYLKMMEKDELEKLERKIAEILEREMPQLKGIMIYGLDMRYTSRNWEVWCEHPTFPPHYELGKQPPRYSVEKCAVCNGMVKMDEMVYRVFMNNVEGMACSEKCVKEANGDEAVIVFTK